MKLAVSYDAEGNITTMFNPEKLAGNNGTLTYVPAPGEKHHTIELPKEFEAKSLSEIHKALRVTANGGAPRFERRA